MKKILVLVLAFALAAASAWALGEATFSGEISAVKDNVVTIRVTEGTTSDLTVGSKVEVNVTEAAACPADVPEKAPAPKSDMLMGC